MAANPPPSQVVIDPQELRELIEWLDRQSRLLAEQRRGLLPVVHFGQHSPCGEINAARNALTGALERFHSVTDAHRHQLLGLTGTLERVLAQYNAADQAGAAALRRLDR